MWQCGKCGESVEDNFDACWKCGTSWDGVEDAQFTGAPVADKITPDVPPQRSDPIACTRCDKPLEYVGRKRFHEGTNWGVLGELGELFVKRQHFDVYVCPQCGCVQFFVDGIGEESRPA